jgi:small subunit ribosomal protein S16
MRFGKIRTPQYRIIICDSRKKRDGKYIEAIGQYRPKEEPSFISVDSERAQYWLGVGAQPTDTVLALLKLTGDWNRFKGLPAEDRVKVAEPKQSRSERAESAAVRVQELAAQQEKLKAEKKAKKADDKAKSEKTKAEKPAKPKAEKAPRTKADAPASAATEAAAPVADASA